VLTTVLQQRSFAAASRALGLSEVTVRKKIEHLEAIGKTELFVRTPTGLEPTADGLNAGALATQMVEHAMATERFLRDRSRDRHGQVRLVTTEGLGTYWIVPKLARQMNENNRTCFNIICQMELPDLEKGEADVAVSLEKIVGKDIETKLVGSLFVRLYASRDYIRRHGMPKNISDFSQHRLVQQVGSQVEKGMGSGDNDFWGGNVVTSMILNTSGSHFQAVLAGAGIGGIPTYVETVTDELVQLDLPFEIRRKIFVSATADRLKVRKVKEAFDAVSSLFNAPYFC
jgi:DNA-binding transcriptional LysR family regulator